MFISFGKFFLIKVSMCSKIVLKYYDFLFGYCFSCKGVKCYKLSEGFFSVVCYNNKVDSKKQCRSTRFLISRRCSNWSTIQKSHCAFHFIQRFSDTCLSSSIPNNRKRRCSNSKPVSICAVELNMRRQAFKLVKSPSTRRLN